MTVMGGASATGPEPPAGAGRLLLADRFHGGVRLASLGAWLAALIVAYLVARWLMALVFGEVGSGAGVIGLLVITLGLGQALAYGAEKLLVAAWPSGRAVVLVQGAVVLAERRGETRLGLPPAGRVNFWRWRFKVKGRQAGRVPNGHFCAGLRLTQGETVIGAYAFLAPAEAEALAAQYPFYELNRPDDGAKSALGGRDTVYLAAERDRWESGAELEPADFEALLAHLAAHLPDFSSGPAS